MLIIYITAFMRIMVLNWNMKLCVFQKPLFLLTKYKYNNKSWRGIFMYQWHQLTLPQWFLHHRPPLIWNYCTNAQQPHHNGDHLRQYFSARHYIKACNYVSYQKPSCVLTKKSTTTTQHLDRYAVFLPHYVKNTFWVTPNKPVCFWFRHQRRTCFYTSFGNMHVYHLHQYFSKCL
jgi:hypothetical protein